MGNLSEYFNQGRVKSHFIGLFINVLRGRHMKIFIMISAALGALIVIGWVFDFLWPELEIDQEIEKLQNEERI